MPRVYINRFRAASDFIGRLPVSPITVARLLSIKEGTPLTTEEHAAVGLIEQLMDIGVLAPEDTLSQAKEVIDACLAESRKEQ